MGAASQAKAKEFNAKMYKHTQLFKFTSVMWDEGLTSRAVYVMTPKNWMDWNASMAPYMEEMMPTFSLATEVKAYYTGVCPVAVKAALKQWEQMPNMKVMEM